MAVELTYQVKGGDFSHAGDASSQVKKVLKQLDIDPKKIKSIVIALYEAEVNVVAHALEGVIRVTVDEEKITMLLTDRGAGIPDIELAMREGYSTASKEVREMGFGAGMGLPNIKRNTDLLEITSEPGQGTTVKMVNFF
ncbi:MAG TPA: anti-sigma regulatory factor [Prolixibacteraceae bacterium]|nr:anti-sigma regulatory factor [Prolixibacteraceae bacterium]